MCSKTIKIALIGCGTHAEQQHAAPLADFARAYPDRIRLVACCDLDITRARRLAHEYGFERAYTDMDHMLDKELPDGVVSVLPVDRIADVGTRLLERGIPCTIEKPLGFSAEEVRALVQTAQKTGTRHMVSVNRRFDPLLNRGLQWAKSRGEVKHISARMHRTGRVEADFLWATGIHVVDAVTFLGGTSVREVNVHRISPGGQVRWFHLMLTFQSGVRCSVEVYPTAGRTLETYQLSGVGWTVEVGVPCGLGPDGAFLSCWHSGKLKVHEVPARDTPPWRANGAYEEMDGFIKSIESGSWTHPTIMDVAPSFDLCWSITKEP